MSAQQLARKPTPRMTIGQYVETSISDFDDDALLAEIESRKLVGSFAVDPDVTLDAMRHAMSRADHQQALELLRTYLQDRLGCVLP